MGKPKIPFVITKVYSLKAVENEDVFEGNTQRLESFFETLEDLTIPLTTSVLTFSLALASMYGLVSKLINKSRILIFCHESPRPMKQVKVLTFE